ncbi:MAG: DUF4168 domain-containing protein [Corticimicrobacter sp.]|uniref:DUF4168 domain-containing protein n=1 Tax=Corticimicrobacter sp. TaxID=2678536 RepID=UPI0032DA4FF9
MQSSLKAFLFAAAVSFGLASPYAMAESRLEPARAETPVQAPAAIDPSDEQLEKYVGAARKIDAVAADYQPRLAGVTDPAERQALLREADGKMIALVERDGLSVDEYNGISVAVQQNPALRQRVVDMLARSQGG